MAEGNASSNALSDHGDHFFDIPEAPSFQPTVDEFQNPTAYINKIRPLAEPYGICKIKPPQDWNPPFAADTDKFKFTPRQQLLSGRLENGCPICAADDAEESFIFCSLCYDGYHPSCLHSKSREETDDMWWCPRCVKGEGHDSRDVPLSKQRYSLSQFGDMADGFKAEYFNMPPLLVPAGRIEDDFWRLRAALDEEVLVEFGDNLSSHEYGSGFQKAYLRSDPQEVREYCRSPWNLHNLALLETSVLRHVKDAQLHVPVVDVGMCFTTHGWMQGQHWLYNISYLHWGETRTWYGVPATASDSFVKFIGHQEPPVADSVRPDKLLEKGVPVFRLEQHATEFVIVFPRAYQLNFSHGFNFAECVNFAPPNWVSEGQLCEKYYSIRRFPARFSYEEVLCRMACSWPHLSPFLGPAVFDNLNECFKDHHSLVEKVRRKGVTSSAKEMMEAIPWDERRCTICHCICFLSALTCSCEPDRIVCLRHSDELCACDHSKYTLRFRYAEEEIPQMLGSLSSWVESLNSWLERAKAAVEFVDEKEDLDSFKSLLSEAEEEHFPESEIVEHLRKTVQDATELAELCSQLGNKKVRTRTWSSTDSKIKLSLVELSSLYSSVKELSCRIPEANSILSLLNRTEQCRQNAVDLLSQDLPDSSELEECIDHAGSLDIHFPEISVLKQRVVQVEWLEEVNALRESSEQVTMYALRRLISVGMELPPHAQVEQVLTELQVLLRSVEDWQDRAKLCLDVKCRQNIGVLESLLEEAKNIPAYLPNIGALQNVLKKGKEWITKVETIQKSDDYPYLEMLERLVAAGRSIPLDLEQLSVLEQHVFAAKAWRDRTSRTFLRKNSLYSLMQALAPRTVVGVESLTTSKKLQQMQYQQLYQTDDVKPVNPAVVVQAFKKAEVQEMMSMRELRAANRHKRTHDAGNASYCLCRRGSSGFMLQCELCKDSFHATCVPLPKSTGTKSRLLTPAQQLAAAATKEVKFLCPCCLRSRRPRLETILSLLVTMHKVPVRLPEGDALKCLTERAMNWQDRARQTLSTEELASALAKLSVLSQKLVEAAAREKTEKIISSELKKAASKPELGINMMSIRTNHTSNMDSLLEKDEHNNSHMFGNSEHAYSYGRFKGAGGIKLEDHSMGFSGSEHAYSSASKPFQCPSNNPGHSAKGRVNMQTPLLSLSEHVRAQLEDLMMEGDLLEVSLDETQHIWRILQATKPRHTNILPDVEVLENELMACKAEKDRMLAEAKKDRRRKHSDMDMCGPPRKIRMSFTKEMEKMRRPRLKGRGFGIKKEVRGVRGPRKRMDDGGAPRKRRKQEDEVDECSARPCLHPLEREVDWVQCDGGCELWFHLFCLGLDKRDVKEDEDFICRVCQARSH